MVGDIEYDYAKLMGYCEANIGSVLPLAEKLCRKPSFKLLHFVVADVAARNGTGWLRIWTEPRSLEEIAKAIYGEKCRADARGAQIMESIKDLSYNNMLHGITLSDGKLSLAFEPFFFSWRKLNNAVTAMYPASIVRLYESFLDRECPFSNASKVGMVKKKFETLHPATRLKLPEDDRNDWKTFVSWLETCDPFDSIGKARFKLEKLPRPLLSKGLVGVSSAEAAIIPVDSFFQKSEPERAFVSKTASRVRLDWRIKLDETPDCDLNPQGGYTHMVEYASREIRRRKRLMYDYPFFVNPLLRDSIGEIRREVMKERQNGVWVFCRWLAEKLDAFSLPSYDSVIENYAKRFDITKHMCDRRDAFLKEGCDPGSTMRPAGPIYTHLSDIWLRENPCRRFVYSACIYGIPVVCAYIALKRLRENERDADRYEAEAGLARVRTLESGATSFALIRKATSLYMSGDPAMAPYEKHSYICGVTPVLKPREDWPEGLYDFTVTLASRIPAQCSGVRP